MQHIERLSAKKQLRANLLDLLERAVLSGTVVSITSGLTLAATAMTKGKSALQPINATSGCY